MKNKVECEWQDVITPNEYGILHLVVDLPNAPGPDTGYVKAILEDEFNFYPYPANYGPGQICYGAVLIDRISGTRWHVEQPWFLNV